MKKYTGTLTLTVEVQFNNPDGSDLTQPEVYLAFTNRLHSLTANTELVEAVLPADDVQSNNIKYEVWVRSRGFNRYGIAMDTPCKDAMFCTEKEAIGYVERASRYSMNHYYIKQIPS